MSTSDNFVFTDRGGVIENTHEVHAAVVDSTGKLLFYVGNPRRVTLLRSAAKPVQALAVVETGAFEQYGFDDADLALMCASHSSEEQHVERARAMLRKVKAEEHNLKCGGHPSINPDIQREWIQTKFTPTRVYSNCSGKHAGTIAAAKAIDAPIEDYHLPDHPIQLRIKATVEEVAGLKPSEIKWGVDGCNMPAPAFSLDYLAKTFALFARAADEMDQPKGQQAFDKRTEWMARIYHSMVRYPELVGGVDRFDTVLMSAYGGQLIGKVGADACYGIGIKASEDTRRLGAKGPIGIAAKISDGNLDILFTALAEILEQLQIGTVETRAALNSFHHVKLTNTMGVVTGHISCPFKVRPA